MRARYHPQPRLWAAALYADRVLLLKDGEAVASGAPEQVLTAANLRAVYDTEVYVGRNPATGAVMVLPASELPRPVR